MLYIRIMNLFCSVEADRETMAESDVPQLLSVDTEGQMDFVRSAIFDIGADMDPSVKQSLIDRFAAMQDRNVQMIKSLDGTQFTLGQVFIAFDESRLPMVFCYYQFFKALVHWPC
jgi:hypothetical protein